MNTPRLFLIGLVLGALGLSGGAGWNASSQDDLSPIPALVPLTQFTSQGHLISFQSEGFLLSNAGYALHVEFVGANPVAPISSQGELNNSAVSPLARVTYPELWEGITLVYDAPAGNILRSTYTLEPGADVEQIRLCYNAPVTLSADGTLAVTYATGQVSETAPVAWQEIGGELVGVEVTFVTQGERQVGFAVGAHDPQIALTIDPVITWNTFLGGSLYDESAGIVVDGDGNVYVVGNSWATWGQEECSDCPIRPYSSDWDAFAAKLDSSGNLVWNTFLGESHRDRGIGITVDGNGNVYVTGVSEAAWGAGECNGCPIRAFTRQVDAFVAKLNSNGTLMWDTFLGGRKDDYGSGIAVDGNGNVYVAGGSHGSWGQGECSGCPIRLRRGGSDTFAAKLDSNGVMMWNTFLGGSVDDDEAGIAVDEDEKVYVTGSSGATWGAGECSGCPIRPYTPSSGLHNGDAFAAKLDSSGALTWNTFLGGVGVTGAVELQLMAAGMCMSRVPVRLLGEPESAAAARSALSRAGLMSLRRNSIQAVR